MEIKKDPKSFQLTSKIKVFLREFNGLLDILYDNKVDFDMYNMDFSFNKIFPYDYIQKKINSEFLLGILVETNFIGLVNTLDNPELLGKLNSYLSKYKIMGGKKHFYLLCQNVTCCMKKEQLLV